MTHHSIKPISIKLLLLITLFYSLSCLALHADCNNPSDFEMHMVCTDNHQGKWIKEITKFGEDVFCAGGNDWLEYYETDLGEKFLGNNNETFLQCSDRACSQSKVIGTDTFTVSKTNNQYTATPRMYLLNIDDSYGENCRW